MTTRGNRRQVMSFIVAIILPCAVLVALSLRMISQERQLAEKRTGEERQRALGAIRQELLTHLEKIKLQQAAALATRKDELLPRKFEDPAIVLVGSVERNRLVLPWDTNPVSERSRRLLGEPKFRDAIQQGEHEELSANQIAKAVALYRAAMDGTHQMVQTGYARLLLARALDKSGKQREAQAHLRKILLLPSDATDEQGIPLFLYAAAGLLRTGVGHKEILERIRGELDAPLEGPPAQAYMMKHLIEDIMNSAPDPSVSAAAKALQRSLTAQIRDLEQALALQNDFPTLGLEEAKARKPGSSEPIWVTYGEDPWLVSLTAPIRESAPMLVAVRAKDAFRVLGSAASGSLSLASQLELVTGVGSKGDLLGENFTGLKVRFETRGEGAPARGWSLQQSFYLASLLLVLSVTLFGAYLLWRDVRREMRLAEMRSQFVSSVSHELKTPLTAIRMFAETLRMGRAAGPEAQAEYLDTIVNETERLSRLLSNVLDFSKIERGERAYRLESNSLAEVVQAAARAMQYPLAQHGFKLRVEIENSLPPVRVDSDAIEQAILNLLANAMKYSGDNLEIELRLLRRDGHAVIQVIDRGIGIPPDEQSRVFERFYRVPSPENKLLPGTGLGLTIVEQIAKAHGGRVEVESAPGKGSTFSIYLPLEGSS